MTEQWEKGSRALVQWNPWSKDRFHLNSGVGRWMRWGEWSSLLYSGQESGQDSEVHLFISNFPSLSEDSPCGIWGSHLRTS
jgi:hypothetical protein